MKISLKVFGYFMLITLASILVASCDKGNKTGSNPFIGTWFGSWDGDECVMDITDSSWFVYLSFADEAHVGAYTYTGNSGKFIANSQGLTGEAIVNGNTITLAVPRRGSMKATKADYKIFDKKLKGTWVNAEGDTTTELKFDNGNLEESMGGVLNIKGMYYTANGAIYLRFTHFYGQGNECSDLELNLDANWYTLDEWSNIVSKKYGIPEERIYGVIAKRFFPRNYSIAGNTLTIDDNSGDKNQYTRK